MSDNNNRPILLSAAMDSELDLLVKQLHGSETKPVLGIPFLFGTIKERQVIVGKTGVGIVSAAVFATAAATLLPKCILNFGTAGGHSPSAHRGDLILGCDCVNLSSYETDSADAAAGCHPEKWRYTSFQEFDDQSLWKVPCDAALLHAAQGCSYPHGTVLTGTLGSGDVWNRETDRILWLNKTLSTLSEDMESFSIYAVAARYHIPVLGVRILSNHELHKEEYDPSLGHVCQEFILNLLEQI